jgi:hypothetical protein
MIVLINFWIKSHNVREPPFDIMMNLLSPTNPKNDYLQKEAIAWDFEEFKYVEI